MRAIRTHDYLYLRNFLPDRWPAGTPNYEKATFYPSYYGDVDGGPTKSYMIAHHQDDSLHARLFALTFNKRPAEELYDLKKDPDQLNNLAGNRRYAEIQQQLRQQLMNELKKTGDPRVKGGEKVFESYPYTGGTPFPDNFKRINRYYATVKIDSFPSRYVTPRPVELLVPVNVSYDETFPVLYMFDGQNLFHSFTGWGGEINAGWRVPEVLDSLNQAGAIPKIIVAGIYNTSKRMSEYMPSKPEALVRQRIAETQHEWYSVFKTSPPAADTQFISNMQVSSSDLGN